MPRQFWLRNSISLGKRGEKNSIGPRFAGVARFMPSRRQEKRAHEQVVKVNNFVSNVVECIDDCFFAARDESEKLQECGWKGGGADRIRERKKEEAQKKGERFFLDEEERSPQTERERERGRERETCEKKRAPLRAKKNHEK